MTETREVVIRLRLEYPPGVPQAVPTAAGDQPLLYGTAQAARLLGIGESSLAELIACGELESVRVKARRLIPREAISDYVCLRLREQARGGARAS